MIKAVCADLYCALCESGTNTSTHSKLRCELLRMLSENFYRDDREFDQAGDRVARLVQDLRAPCSPVTQEDFP